jgi:hypothetical protein
MQNPDIEISYHHDEDPDLSFHFDVNPDPEFQRAFSKLASNFKKPNKNLIVAVKNIHLVPLSL